MAENVVGDLYWELDGQLGEIKRQLRQPRGYPYDPHKLKEALQAVVEGRFGQVETSSLLGIFIPAYQQLNCVKSRNITRNWGFTEEHFEKLGEPPTWPNGLLSAVVLDVGLDTVEQTFEEAWACIVESQKDHNGDHWRWDGVKSDKEHLRLHGGKAHERGLRWQVIDFAANWDKKEGVRPKDVREQNSPHSAILWAASYFPKWVQAMDGTNVPYVWLPGYELNVSGSEWWSDIPNLRWYRAPRWVKLNALFADHRGYYWAVPSLRE